MHLTDASTADRAGTACSVEHFHLATRAGTHVPRRYPRRAEQDRPTPASGPLRAEACLRIRHEEAAFVETSTVLNLTDLASPDSHAAVAMVAEHHPDCEQPHCPMAIEVVA